MRLFAVLLILLPLALVAAEAAPPKQGDAMERPAETKAAWKAQADEVQPLDDAPWFSGCMVWRGRADREYKPFHQWELRIEAGKLKRRGLRLRVSALGPDLKPLLGREGHWVALGDLDAGARADLSYKLNCSNPTAVRAELQWQGGEQRYLAIGDGALPQPEEAKGAQILVLQPDFRYDKGKKAAFVTFHLRNEGNDAATGVVQSIHFLDDKKTPVHTHQHVPNDGTLPAGYAEDQKLLVKGVPKFKTIAIGTKTANASGPVLDPGAFTDAAEIQVAHLTIRDGELLARVRNGLAEDVRGLVVTLRLYDEANTELAAVPFKPGDMAAGAEADVREPLAALEGTPVAWSIELSFGGGEPTAGAAPRLEPIVVEGLALEVAELAVGDDGLRLRGALRNGRDAALQQLVVDLLIDDGAGGEARQAVEVGALDAGASHALDLLVPGVEAVGGLQMSWRSQQPASQDGGEEVAGEGPAEAEGDADAEADAD